MVIISYILETGKDLITFKEELINSLNDSFYTYQYQRKQNAPSITLEKEYLDGNDRFAVNPKAVVDVVRKQMLKECDKKKTNNMMHCFNNST